MKLQVTLHIGPEDIMLHAQVTLWTVPLYIVTIDSLATVHLSNPVDSLVTLLLVQLY